MLNIKIVAVLVSMVVSVTAHAEDNPGIAIPPAVQSSVKAMGCDACHGWERTKFGPSWQNVADRYRGPDKLMFTRDSISTALVKSCPLCRDL